MSYRDYYDDLIAGNLSSIYGFYGPETFIIKSMLNLTKEKLIASGLEELDYASVSGKNMGFLDAKGLVDMPPFASKKRVVVIENPDFIDTDKWGKKKIDRFLDLHKDPESILTILLFDKIDRRKYGSKALLKIGKLVEFTRLDRKSLIRWIQKSKFLDKEISPSAATYIADESGYLEKTPLIDLFGLKSLLEVISDGIDGNVIELQDVQRHIETKLHGNVFKWRDSLIRGRTSEALGYFKDLISEGEHPIKLLSILQSQVRETYKYSLLKRVGMSDSAIAKKMKKHDFVVREYGVIYSLYSDDGLSKLLSIVLEADDLVKMGSTDGVLVLQTLSFQVKRLLGSKKNLF